LTGPLIRFIRAQRSKQVLAQIDGQLEQGEEVLHWARVKDPRTKDRGFVYLTRARYILDWGDDRDPLSTRWKEIDRWGVNSEPHDGPIVGIEQQDGAKFMQLPIVTSGAEIRVTEFLHSWSRLAPEDATQHIDGRDLGTFRGPEAAVQFTAPRRNFVRRVLFTILGVLLIIAALLIGWLPGPGGIFLAIAGLWVLAQEYDWAEDALDWMRDKYREAKHKIQERRAKKKERRAGKRA
jgi:Putative transmembrane protein (PGPGW)